jgi:hypothetical protein
MITLLLLFAFKVATAGELACIGSIQDSKIQEDIYIAGVSGDGVAATGNPGQILYLNGPGVSFLKPGTVQRVVRPEGKVRDPRTGVKIGVYYRDIGTVKIEVVEQEDATARIVTACEGLLKGDVVVPSPQRPVVEFKGKLSNDLTPVRGGLVSTILFGKADMRELTAGEFCFIQLGRKDGIQAGDHFVVYRPNQAFNARDMALSGSGADTLYDPIRKGILPDKMESMLKNRSLPLRVLGDLIIVETGDKMSTARIVNSLVEIHPGDFVVKR